MEWKNWIKVISLFTFSHIYCLLSKLPYEARMIIDIQSCAISIRQSRILFFFLIENFKASVQFKLICFIQIKR